MKDFFETLYLDPRFEGEIISLPYKGETLLLTNTSNKSIKEIMDVVRDYNKKGDDRVSVELEIKGKMNSEVVEIISICMELSTYWGGVELKDDEFLEALKLDSRMSTKEGLGRIIFEQIKENG
jgi:hypothetical protein